ncbi:hypothetical protein [Fusobacterium ulcerans]
MEQQSKAQQQSTGEMIEIRKKVSI